MADSPYTGVEHIEPNQAQKEVTANNGFDRLSLFVAETLSVTISGDRLLTEIEFQEAVHFVLGGTPSAGFLFELPSTVKKSFIVNNQSGQTATVQVAGGGGTSIAVANAEQTLLYTDGADVIAAGGGSGSGGSFDSLTDTNFTGLTNGDVAQYNGASWTNLPLLASSRPAIQPWKGALATLTSDKTGLTFPYVVSWDQATLDTDTFWDSGNPERLTVPTGVTKVRLHAAIEMDDDTSAGSIFLSFQKNGTSLSVASGTENSAQSSSGFNNVNHSITSGVLEVTAGDYFTLRINPSGLTTTGLHTANTFLEIEVLETSDAQASPLDVGIYKPGQPTGSEVIARWVSTRAFTFPSGLTGSQAYAATAPADGAKDFDVQKNGSSVGTVSFALGSNTATFTMASATSFVAGDRLAFVAPATADSALADIAITLKGTKD